jgi:hypothetical protein
VTSGTVSRIELEGGFFGVVSDSGEKLFPVDLPDQFRIDGLRIRFVERDTSVFTIQMWGRAVSLDRVSRID